MRAKTGAVARLGERFRAFLLALLSRSGYSGGVVDNKRLLAEVSDHLPNVEPMWLRYDGAPLSLSDDGEVENVNDLELSLAEVGEDGIKWRNGLPVSVEPNVAFRPTLARGSRGNHGLFHKMFLTSTTFQRAWGGVYQSQLTGDWTVSVPDVEDYTPHELAVEKARAREISNALLENLEGGWGQFLRDALYMLIGGFAIFEEVYRATDDENGYAGSVKKLAFRYCSAVSKWILDDNERELVAVEFKRPDGTTYVVPAENLLLLTFNRFGNNFEGISALRPVIRWIEALQFFQRLELVAAEKYGSPWVTAARKGKDLPPISQDEKDELVDIIDDAIAAENPVIVLPDNTEMVVSSPAGVMPNFDAQKRFCLERIAEPLKAEGSLIGLGQTGAFAARQSATMDFVNSAPYYAKLIAGPLNGADNTLYTGTIPKMYRAMFGEPMRPGRYPKLAYSAGISEDSAWFANLQMAAQAGLVETTDKARKVAHQRLGLPVEPEAVEEQDQGVLHAV